MGAFANLGSFFGENLVTIAKKCGYHQSNILILESKIEQLQNEYPNVYKALNSCTHHRDSRTPLQYAQDLVASWLFEDYILQLCSENGLDIEGDGADKNREILSSAKVSASSDSLVTLNGKSRPMEIMTDYGGYWSRTGLLDLRDSKYMKLENSRSLFLGFSTKDNKYLLIDFSEPVPSKYIRSHFPYGGKPAYQISCKGLLQKFDINKVISEIKSKF